MRYIPLEMPVAIQASRSDLAMLKYRRGELTAEFYVPDDDGHRLRVQFSRVEAFRSVDEMPLSTEDNEHQWDGHVSEHVAYLMEDGFFWRTQSSAFHDMFPEARHYLFITGWMCLDVISQNEPVLALVSSTGAEAGG